MSILEEKFYKLTKRCHKFIHYFELYETHFEKYVGKSPRILEIGVFGGGSLELWKEYFGPGTTVVGVDKNPQCKKYEEEDIEIIIDDQTNRELWFDMPSENFDIIIDDGSHICSHQITTLEMTYRLIKEGGTYWCEDVHTSYYEAYGGGLYSPTSFISFTKSIIDVINDYHTKRIYKTGENPLNKLDPNFVDIFEDIQGIHFYDSVVVIDKGKRPIIKDVIVNNANKKN